MGRKKRRNNNNRAPGENAAPLQNHLPPARRQLAQEAVELPSLMVALFDLYGFFHQSSASSPPIASSDTAASTPNNDASSSSSSVGQSSPSTCAQKHRLDLQSSLTSLSQVLRTAGAIERCLLVENEAGHCSEEQDDDKVARQYLLRLEETATTVRRDMDRFLSTMEEERREIVQHHHDFLEEVSSSLLIMCSHHHHHHAASSSSPWGLLARSLLAEYRGQSSREQLLVQKLTGLFDTLYHSVLAASTDEMDDGTMAKTQKQLIETSDCLSRSTLTGKLEYQEALALIQSMLAEPESRSRAMDTMHDRLLPSCRSSKGNVVIDETPTAAQTKTSTSSEHYAYWTKLYFADTIRSAFDAFLGLKTTPSESSIISSVLVVGDQGAGKTHLCNQLEQQASQTTAPCLVIRPQLPLDMLQNSVGGAEDILMSIFGAIHNAQQSHVLVLLDNVDSAIANPSQQDSVLSGSSDLTCSHLQQRCHATFLVLMESLHTFLKGKGLRVLLLCTATQDLNYTFNRFDRTFYLGPPNATDRERLIRNQFMIDEEEVAVGQDYQRMGLLLSELVESTVGRSYAELVQYCRQAVTSLSTVTNSTLSENTNMQALQELKERLKMITPESLRSGVIVDYVDMRVLTARDLQNSQLIRNARSGQYEFPMKGKSAKDAWAILKSSIIIPLCRSRDLLSLLVGSGGRNDKSVVGGILIHGESCSGKSEIAMHCAKYAAELLSSVKLIDVSCTSLVHKEVGGSEKAIHHLFDAARRASPCVLLMDGIESIAAVRGNDTTTEGTMDRILSTLLVELDGIDDSFIGSQHEGGIAVIGVSTDARWIDPALKRPGRLDRVVKLARDWL